MKQLENLKVHNRISDYWYFVMQTTAQKMKFSVKDFVSKYDQIRNFLRI